MPLQIVNVGTTQNDGTGDPLRTAMQKINANTNVLNYGVFNVKDATYGAVGNGRVLTDITTTAGSAVISSASYSFTAGDVGKLITIVGGGSSQTLTSGSIVNPTNATISSVSGGNATLSKTVTVAFSGNGVGTFGTNDTAAMQAAITAAAAGSAAMNPGGLVYLPNGIFIINATLVWPSYVSMNGNGMGNSIIKWISTTDIASPMIQPSDTSGATIYYDCQFRDFEMDADAATMATPSYQGKALTIPNSRRFLAQNIFVHGTPATGIAFDQSRESAAIDCLTLNTGRLQPPTGGSGIGNGVGGSNQPESYTIKGCKIVNPYSYGIFYEEQTGSANATTANSIIDGNVIIMGQYTKNGIGDCGLSHSVITNNIVYGYGTGVGRGIAVDQGTLNNNPGIKGTIANNTVYNCQFGVLIYYATVSPTTCQYVVSGNKVDLCGTGIEIVSGSSTTLDILNITGNSVSFCNNAGIYLTGTAIMRDVTIANNTCYNNGQTGATNQKAGISIVGVPIARLDINNNKCFDNQQVSSNTQNYGIILDGSATSITNSTITNNSLQHNFVGPISITNSATFSGISNNNYGLGVRTISTGSSDTANAIDSTIIWRSTTAAAKAQSIPGATSANLAQQMRIKDGAQTAGTYNITITPASGTINGASTYVLTTNGQSVTIQSDGVSDWVIE